MFIIFKKTIGIDGYVIYATRVHGQTQLILRETKKTELVNCDSLFIKCLAQSD